MSVRAPLSEPAEFPSVQFFSGALGGRGEWTGLAECLGPDFGSEALGHVQFSDPPTHVVAHGTAVADVLRAAAERPWGFKSLTLIDPDIDRMLPALAADPACHTVHAMRHNLGFLLAEGEAWIAMGAVIDHAMGRGAWDRTSYPLQVRLAARIGTLIRAWESQAAAPMDEVELAGIVCPTLVVTGRRAPEEIRAAQDYLVQAIPFARRLLIPAAGVAGHLTDPHLFGPAIREFLVRAGRQWQTDGANVQFAA